MWMLYSKDGILCNLKGDVKIHWFAAFVNDRLPCAPKKCFDLIDCRVMMQLHSPPPSQIAVSMTFNMF